MTKEGFKKYEDAVNTVCAECIYCINEDGDGDGTICDACCVRQRYEELADIFDRESGDHMKRKFDINNFGDVMEAAALIGLDPNAVCWDMDDDEILRKANKIIKTWSDEELEELWDRCD